MNTPLESEILRTAQAAIAESIVKNLTGYNGALSKLCDRVMAANEAALHNLISEEVTRTVLSSDFRAEMKSALNAKLARILIERMGGELEKRVNELKADPTTRAKITLAIQQALSQ